MKNWSLSLVVAIALLLTPPLMETVRAQSEAVLDTTLESGTSQGDNVTDNATDNATESATQTKCWWLRLRGVPGKGILTAPGLQKPFNPNWKGSKAIEKGLRLRTQEQTSVTEQTQNHGEEQGLTVREKTRQEIQLQQQTQNQGSGGGPKGKGKKGQP